MANLLTIPDIIYFEIYNKDSEIFECFLVRVNLLSFLNDNPVGNNIFKVNNRNTRTRCKICSKLTIKTPEIRHWCRSGVFIVNFEHVYPFF